MAIYSLQHSSIGRTTHAAGTAGAHVMYITRHSAAECVLGEGMPDVPRQAKVWLDAQEMAERKNARVVDKIMVALPRELDDAGRQQLVERFVHEVIGGEHKVPWLAAIHSKGKDAGNPHAHIVIRDRSVDTGKRVVELSSKGSTERVRTIWERCANASLQEIGIDARIDRRSLKEQGIDRVPLIHEGPEARALERKGERPESQVRKQQLLNGQEREIRYPEIDQNRTRAERNAEIIVLNQYKQLPDDLQALERVYQKKMEEQAVINDLRAGELKKKIEAELEEKRHQLVLHQQNHPKAPMILLRKQAHENRVKVWEEAKKKIELRVQELKQRWEKLAEYSRKLVDLLNSKAQNLAHAQVQKLHPELAKKLAHHRGIAMQKRGIEIDKELERKKQAKLEQGLGRGRKM
jgi:hypothetical protein